MKLKGKDGKEYTGETKGGAYAVSDADGKNVGNFAREADAVKLGGFTLVAEEAKPAAETPKTGDQGSTPDTEKGSGQEQPKTDTPPSDTPPASSPEKKPEGQPA